MIVLDEEDQQHLKPFASSGPTLRLPERAADHPTSLLLPDYETSQALHDSSHLDKTPRRLRRRRRALDSQFCKASLAALVVYIVITISVGLPFILRKSPKSSDDTADDQPLLLSRLSQVDWEDFPLDQEGSNMSETDQSQICNEWDSMDETKSSHQLTASRAFRLDFNDILTIRSNAAGGVNYGNLTFCSNPDETATDPILLFTAYSSNPRLRNDVKVCYHPTKPTRGFDFFLPPIESTDDLDLDIRILFPVNTPSSSTYPFALQRISTSMPYFFQHLRDLPSDLSFRELSLQGVQSEIFVEDVTAEKVAIKSSSAPIHGRFNVSNSIVLDTIAGYIDADVTLFHNPSSGPRQLLCAMDTGNERISADIVLHSQAFTSTPQPLFLADVRTFNAPIDLNIRHHSSTPPSLFHLQAETTSGHLEVTIDTKYTGWFDLQSKGVDRSTKVNEERIDAAQNSGSRGYHYSRLSKERTYGWVGAGGMPSTFKRSEVGNLEVLSLLNDATLTFVDSS
ncbi:hypothetical protein BDV98DRAFT_603641 [Pterulicium gracile]|uniref:Uncharacterized protein n=1 Tax=Pterulicium gracile TaxID=1884261 RepID=A0A5C3QM70_9AGAR|nr:hypothetical protein BDV98DRAFT_603641 [Pterula gracilis]